MKFQYINPLAFVGLALMATGCTDNSWNDHFLDGFDGKPTYDNSVTVDYTLTTTDYETIGKALQNIATTDEEIAAARAIQSNHYFDQNSPYPAQIAVPYLLNQEQSNFYIYNSGSTINVTLQQAEVPADIAAISAAKTMTVADGTSSSSIPGMLAAEYPDAQEGDYAIVTVGGESGEAVTWTVAQALAQMNAGYEGEATVSGIISSIQELSTQYGNATYFIKDNLSDDASLEVYRGYGLDNTKFTSEDQLQVGAAVVVTGNLVNYNGTFEFTSGNYITSYTAPATKSGSAKTRAVDLTSNIKDLSEGSNLTATAVVTAQCGRGIILTDNAGSIFYYDNNVDLATYTIGTVVEVSGTVAVYGGYQLTNTATLKVVGSETYTYPTPTAYSAEMIEKAIVDNTPNTAAYISYEGTLAISGNYYNINIPGVTSGQGSLYTPTDALKEKLEDGKTYKFTGYFTGITSGKYFYMVLTNVENVSGGNTGGGNTGGDNNGGNTGGDTGNTEGGENVIYQYNGSAWVVAPDAVVMQPSDYEALGVANNKLSDPAVYLPVYMKNAYPFATAGTEKYIAYNLGNNSCSCSLLTYDGYNWTYVDNFIEEKVAAFVKSNLTYSFRKYIGQEVFNFYDGEKIGLNCSYLIVYGGVCMEPVPTGKTYGYPGETPVVINNGQIVMSNGDNAFTFTTTTEYNGNTYTTPEGYFLILDANGRYMYLQGTYSSFNVRSNNAYIESDGTISVQYLFKASKNDDGTWSIVNEQEGITRTLYYSDGNADFAAYTDEQLSRYNGKFPYLYISETSNPNASDSDAE
ncbi:MAG: hypothetical protein J1E82_00210 [Muribaculaceae bacterium]|nr:hypothetical protein [Muribaculaceae bacterium]